MQRDTKNDKLREELGSRGGLLVGVIVAAVVVVSVILVLLTMRQVNSPRISQAQLALTPDSGRPAPPVRDSSSGRGGLLVGPLSIPDGGWPTEPRSYDLMDEIPEGVLQQGSVGEQIEEDETTAGDVRISRFFIDRYEITNEQYNICVEAGVCRPKAEFDSDRFGSPRQPVVGVSWHDAATYCIWAGKRLPTEAEWERAARGDDRRIYPWGDTPPTCEQAVFTQCDRYGPAEVGRRPDGAGPFGTQDLAGNVWEWIQDWYAPRYYPSTSEADPQGPPAGRERVLRGGSWHYGPLYVRAANRHSDDPQHRTPWYGFRCAYSPPPPTPPPSNTLTVTPDGGPPPRGTIGRARGPSPLPTEEETFSEMAPNPESESEEELPLSDEPAP
jgi:formylglycine-generating enzyme